MKFQWASGLILLGAATVGAYMPAEFSYKSTDDDRPDTGDRVTGHIKWQSPPVNSTLLNPKSYNVSCSGEHVDHKCQRAIDGWSDTYWHSDCKEKGAPWIVADLGAELNVSGLTMLPRLDESVSRGQISDHRIYVSMDKANWGEPVAYGNWGRNKGMKLAAFDPKPARYVKLVADSESHPETPRTPQGWTTIVNLGIYTADYTVPVEPGKGLWGPTIDLPVIAVGSAQVKSGEIIMWSAWSEDKYFASPGGKTLTTTWSPQKKSVDQDLIYNTQHDMFCPGMSMDFDGNIIVSGGSDAGRTSIYTGDGWLRSNDLVLPRGYHASTTLSDGRIFAIGGSWSGGNKVLKTGEVYNPIKKKWYTRSGTDVTAMMTGDKMGQFRADNHAWLFGWKNETIFQGGPSVAMNWYTVQGRGNTIPAGRRLEDHDSTSGNAVMYDATKGKIITFGGQTSYDGSYGSNHAHLITLGEPLEPPLVQVAGNGSGGGMNYIRVYHTSVVLPDGKVFVAGGQAWGAPFNESTVAFTPEIYDPDTDTFVPQNGNNMVRVYHSVSMLLPDATVLNGGGGLCGNCSANHYDAQIFTPQYLLTPDGQKRTRPAITNAPESVVVGGSIEFSTNSMVGSASLIRQGTATHTVNTDQRRIPLEIDCLGNHKFTAKLPDDAGIILPGWYMLFALDIHGTPSEAAIVKVKLPQYSQMEYEDEDKEDYMYNHVDVEDAEQEEDCDDMEGDGVNDDVKGMVAFLSSSSGKFWKSWKSALISQV